MINFIMLQFRKSDWFNLMLPDISIGRAPDYKRFSLLGRRSFKGGGGDSHTGSNSNTR